MHCSKNKNKVTARTSYNNNNKPEQKETQLHDDKTKHNIQSDNKAYNRRNNSHILGQRNKTEIIFVITLSPSRVLDLACVPVITTNAVVIVTYIECITVPRNGNTLAFMSTH